MPEERLQKILSRAGVTSRRKAEQMILEGRVTVNGKVVVELGSKADLSRDHIKVDGKLLHEPRRLRYLAFNKPDACVTTMHDPQGRRTVMDLVRGVRERVYPVGRLDYHSEGLLLFTNDGELANRITSAASKVAKTYVVKTSGTLTPDEEERFRGGVPVHGRRTAPAELKLIGRGVHPWYQVRIVEGRQNQIRLMFQHFGQMVERLKRVRIGFLDLGSLKPGQWRDLTPAEIGRFRKQLRLETEDAGG